MKAKALFAGIAIALASTVAHAANTYVLTLDDTNENQIVGKLYTNDVQTDTMNFPAENATVSFFLKNHQTLPANLDNQFNFYEPGITPLVLSDTAEISGIGGEFSVLITFLSDDSSPLSPLPNGGVNFETGLFQNIAQFTTSNGDSYTFQIASDAVEAIPEPATWAMMLLGLAGLGAAMRTTRRKSGAALAEA
jgi:hypothetical protein